MGNDSAVADSGPLNHLAQIDGEVVWDTLERILVNDQVLKELSEGDHPEVKFLHTSRCEIVNLSKRQIRTYMTKITGANLSATDRCLIGLALARHVGLVATDDLAARRHIHRHGLQPIGTLGLLLRAYREGLLDRRTIERLLDNIASVSTLYVTPNLIETVHRSIRMYDRQQAEAKEKS